MRNLKLPVQILRFFDLQSFHNSKPLHDTCKPARIGVPARASNNSPLLARNEGKEKNMEDPVLLEVIEGLLCGSIPSFLVVPT